MKPLDNSTGVGLYPVEDWADEYKTVHQEDPGWLFDPDAIHLATQPRPTAAECVELLDLERYQRLVWRDKIVEQAQGNNRAIQPVLDIAGIDYATIPDAAAAVEHLMRNVRCLVFRHKVDYGRARPHRRCTALGPMFMPKSHPLHPGHGSFPAGHAAYAYFWATLLGKFPQLFDQAKRQRMLDEAWNVACNRERAGLHFRSDTEAGKELGEKIADAILPKIASVSGFNALMRR